MAMGGIMRCEMIHTARFSPPVRKRARLYAAMVPKNIASRVLLPAMNSELKTVSASPSLNSTRKLSNWMAAGYHAGGEEKISSGVLKAIMNSQ